MKILITSGGCKVPIDEVRHIGNFSSGLYGRELGEVFLDAGHEVIFFFEKGSQCPQCCMRGLSYSKLQRFIYKDYQEYLQVKDLITLHKPDIIISAAAISDYILDKTEGKISSDQDTLTLTLKKGEKIIKSFRELAPNAFIVGFKLLVSPTYEERWKAISKVSEYCDAVIYNDLTELRKGNSGRDLCHPLGDNTNLSVGKVVKHILELQKYKL